MAIGNDGNDVDTAFCVGTLGIGAMELGNGTLGIGTVLDVGGILGSLVVSGWVTRFAGGCYRYISLVVGGAWENDATLGSG